MARLTPVRRVADASIVFLVVETNLAVTYRFFLADADIFVYYFSSIVVESMP